MILNSYLVMIIAFLLLLLLLLPSTYHAIILNICSKHYMVH